MNSIAIHIEHLTGLSAPTQLKVLATLLIVFALWLVRRLVTRTVLRRTIDVRRTYVRRKTITYITALVGMLVIARIWITGLEHLATYLGLLSAGLAIALREPVVNLAGWMFITWRKPFVVGDRIQIGDHAGDVVDVRIFQFTLMEIGNWVASDQPTGRLIHVPNGKVFSDPQANYTTAFRFIWNEIAVLVTFESNWQAAKTLLEETTLRHTAKQGDIARRSFQEAARHFLISVSDIEPRVYTTVEASGVLLTIRYLCDPHERRITEQAIWEDVLRSFAARDDIDFAYPTTRFYDNPAEGKPGTLTPKTPPGTQTADPA